MNIITLMALSFWILENDDVTCNPRIEYRDTEKKKNKQ